MKKLVCVLCLFFMICGTSIAVKGDSGSITSFKFSNTNSDVLTFYSAQWKDNCSKGFFWGFSYNVELSGLSCTKYNGLDPYYADSIKHTDYIYFDMLAGSISFTPLQGATVTTGSRYVAYTYSVTNEFAIYSSFLYNESVYYPIALKPYFRTSGEVQIGSTFYHVDSDVKDLK